MATNPDIFINCFSIKFLSVVPLLDLSLFKIHGLADHLFGDFAASP